MNGSEAGNMSLDWIILKKSEWKASAKSGAKGYPDTHLNRQQLGTKSLKNLP